LNDGELQPVPHAVDAVQADADSSAEIELALGILANDGAQALAVDVLVIDQGIERYKTFHEEIRQLHEESVLGQADDERVKFVAEVLRHEVDLLPLHQFALGVLGAALGFGSFRGEGVEFLGMKEGRTRERSRPG
jgi:hypothetical protein